MLRLRHDTPAEWAAVALADLDAFLQDHAANERKVSASALTLAVQHPDRRELVAKMIEVAQEELEHFRQIHDLLAARGTPLAHDAPDPYISALRRCLRKSRVDDYLLDRLVCFGVIEARGCERFTLLCGALEPGPLKRFYADIVRSEARHHALYLNLAHLYFDRERVDARLDQLLDAEADIARAMPLRPSLH